MNTGTMAGCLPAKNFRPNYSRSAKLKPVWVPVKVLEKINIKGLNADAFYVYITRSKSNGSGAWASRMNNGVKELNVNSIPERGKYITTDDEELKRLVALAQQAAQERKWSGGDNAKMIADVMGMMYDAKSSYHSYYNQIKEQHPNRSYEKARKCAERCAVWDWIIANYPKNRKGIKEIFFNAYISVIPNDNIKTLDSFGNYMIDCKKYGVFEKRDKRAEREVSKRTSKLQIAFLQFMYMQASKISFKRAYHKLVEYCAKIGEHPCSESTAKKYFREFKNNAELNLLRNGAVAAQKSAPYASTLPAQAKNTQWSMDGYNGPFNGLNYLAYVGVLVRDNHSRKIIGFGFGPRENATTILQALQDAMENTGCIAGEIVCDKHTSLKTTQVSQLMAETEKMGVVWTVTVNAQRNAIGERYHQYLDDTFCEFDGYKGKGIRSKKEDSRPSDEEYERIGKSRNWKTEEEIKAIYLYAIDRYNKTPLTALNGQTPNEAYEASADGKCFRLTEQERLKLIRPVRKYTVQRGQITIKVGVTKHEFQLSAELIDRYNNRELLVVYEDLTQGIYITDPKTGEELGDVPPKRKIHGAVHDQTEEDKRYLNQLAGRKKGVTTKARKEAVSKIAAALKENPEAIEFMNTAALPKDIRKIALQDSALKRAGINPNLMPIRTPKVTTIEMPEPAWKNKGPFAVTGKNESMQRLSIEELIGE
ncbi:MAG: hypothetical protein JNM41_11175 [Flavipsychrobacter sp.]|nr:hypothetical protein [Flavipsychrobacter sp.]